MAHHILKIERPYMEAKAAGVKPFEVRFNDRNISVGDTVQYTQSEPPYRDCLGVYEIIYLTSFEQKDGWVVFADRLINK